VTFNTAAVLYPFQCSAFSLNEFTIPYKDDTADIDEYLHQQGDGGGSSAG